MNIEPHTLTPDELLHFHGDSPLAPALRMAQEQLEQAGKALAAARDLQQGVRDLAHDFENDSVADFMKGLPARIEQLVRLEDAMTEADDGELG